MSPTHIALSIALCCTLASVSAQSPPAESKISLKVDASGSYEVLVGGESWFTSGPTAVWKDGKELSSADGSLKPGPIETWEGTDVTGAYKGTQLAWMDGTTSTLITQFKAYADHIIFEQRAGVSLNCATGNKDSTGTTFPSFKAIDTKAKRGALAYDGDMVGSGYKSFEWSSTTSAVPGGLRGTSPLVIFTEDLGTSVVISPAYQFMATSQHWDNKTSTLSYGVMGSATMIPAGFQTQVIISVSSGVSKALMDWGDILLKKYGKDRQGVEYDFTLNYLGYSTDNGAFYYYYTEPNKTYEDTMIDVKTYADSVGIPYRHWLADSWWYYKGVGDGVKNWTARGDIFPHGLDYVYNKTGWPVVGHNRYWSSNTDYAIQVLNVLL
jgi:hypothetical protein